MDRTLAGARSTPVLLGRGLAVARLAPLLLLLAACDSTGYRHTYVQGLVGANALGSGQLDFTKLPPDQEGQASESVPTAPMIAFAWQQPLTGERERNAGVEVGATYTFWVDSVDVYGYAGGGGALVVLDFQNRMWMTEFFFGPYGTVMAGDRWRLYGGTGPTLVWASIDYETEYVTAGGERIETAGTDHDGSLGLYARAGLEYTVDRSTFVGVGVRWMRTDLEFRDLDTAFVLETWAIYASFTAKF